MFLAPEGRHRVARGASPRTPEYGRNARAPKGRHPAVARCRPFGARGSFVVVLFLGLTPRATPCRPPGAENNSRPGHDPPSRLMLLRDNPVLSRELLVNLRSPRAFVLQFAYVAFLSVVVYMAWPQGEGSAHQVGA